MKDLFEPTNVGAISVKNRIFMAPLTRSRAVNENDNPSNMAATYYRQRASAGLIVTEATQISPLGKGYLKTPGIYTDEHVKLWKEITDGVHAEGGKMVLQLWHVGRISHTSLLPDNRAPYAPSAIQADAETFTSSGKQQTSKPQAMTQEDIDNTIKDYRHAAQCAKDAGFDGVEVHAANGYLLNQFLCDKTNKRNDNYGGSVHNRAQLLFEVLDAVEQIWSNDRIGIRLSPTGKTNDVDDSDPMKIFGYVIDEINKHNLAYLHIVERFPGANATNEDIHILQTLIDKWDGFYIANGGYDLMSAEDATHSERADAIAFGRPFIANPDLAERLQLGAELNEPDQDTFYQGGAKGYIDYPKIDSKKAA